MGDRRDDRAGRTVPSWRAGMLRYVGTREGVGTPGESNRGQVKTESRPVAPVPGGASALAGAGAIGLRQA